MPLFAMVGVHAHVCDGADPHTSQAVAHGSVGDPEVANDGAAILNDKTLRHVPVRIGALVAFEVVARGVNERPVHNVQGFVAPVGAQFANSRVHGQRVGRLQVRKIGPTRWRPGQ